MWVFLKFKYRKCKQYSNIKINLNHIKSLNGRVTDLSNQMGILLILPAGLDAQSEYLKEINDQFKVRSQQK